MAADDEIPALDAIPGWPMPEQQTAWHGDPGAERVLRNAYAGGRMHHAWLIGGPKGAGKATLALRFARFVLANPDPARLPPGETLAVDPEHRAARQVAAGSHPNLLLLRRPWDPKAERYKTVLTVDEVRRIQWFFNTTPGESGWRIAVIDSADEFNPQAANALLKMLEEPPRQSLFLLVSNAPGQLLPTIRSRTRRLDLAPLPADAIAAALRDHVGADEDTVRLAAALAGGSLRRAILLAGGEGLAVYRRFRAIADALPKVDFTAVHGLADVATAKTGDGYEAFLDTARDWMARRVRGVPEPGGAGGGALPPLRVAELWETFAASTQQADELNLEKRQVVLQFFLALEAAARL